MRVRALPTLFTAPALCALLVAAAPAGAEDFFEEVETRAEPTEADDSPWSHQLWLQQKTGLGYRTPAAQVNRDSAGLNRTETQLFTRVEYHGEQWRLRLAGSLIQDWLPDLQRAGAVSDPHFTTEQRRDRQWRGEIADSYLAWHAGDWRLRGGYQTLAWGESEVLRITDVLARRDQRWTGQEELENLRLPVPALRATWRGNLDLVALARTPTDRQPAAGEEFDPYLDLRATGAEIERQRRSSPGWALRWRSQWPGLDAQFMLADVYSFDTAPVAVNFAPQGGPAPQRITLAPSRLRVAGAAAQMSRGNWVIKTEQAWHDGVAMATDNPLAPWPTQDQWRGMLGAEYHGINQLTLSAELAGQHTVDAPENLAEHKSRAGTALRARYTLLNERLTLSALAVRLPGDEGDVIRLEADWDASDSVNASLALVDYRASEPEQLIHPYRRNDALVLNLRWYL